MRKKIGMAVVGLAAVVGGCGDSSPGKAPLLSASVCTGGWQQLKPPVAYDILSPLVQKDGALYYAAFTTQDLHTLPATGGADSVVAPVYSNNLWADGDQLLFTNGAQLMGIPVTGGTPAVVVDGAAGRTDAGLAIHTTISPTDFLWFEQSPTSGQGPGTVWRASRPGGTPTQIGLITEQWEGATLHFSDIAAGSDAVILAEMFNGIARAVPFDGGPVRALAATADPIDTTLEGVDGTGAYWSMPRPNAPTDDDQWMTVRAPADGGALQDLWPDQPPHTGTEGIWSDGAGGWVVATDRFFDDRHFHMAIYALAANGDANLLACSPGAEPIGPQIIFRPAVTADAFYAIVNHFGGAEDTWEIVRVATRVP